MRDATRGDSYFVVTFSYIYVKLEMIRKKKIIIWNLDKIRRAGRVERRRLSENTWSTTLRIAARIYVNSFFSSLLSSFSSLGPKSRAESDFSEIGRHQLRVPRLKNLDNIHVRHLGSIYVCRCRFNRISSHFQRRSDSFFILNIRNHGEVRS